MIPDKVVDSVLAQGGIGAAVALFVSFAAIGAIGFIWRVMRDAQKETKDTRDQSIKDVKAGYESRIVALELIQERMNSVIERNSAVLADNTRVMAAKDEAIRDTAMTLAKLVVSYESRMGNLSAQLDRIEAGVTKSNDMIRPAVRR